MDYNMLQKDHNKALEVIQQLRGMIILIATEYHFLSCMNPTKPRDFRICIEDSNCGAATAILKDTEKIK